MTELELMRYRALKARIERNQDKLYDLKTKEITTICGKVKSSLSVHPYIQTHVTVQMNDPTEDAINTSRMKAVEKLIENDKVKVKEIENYINNIDDPNLQSIFEMRVYDNMNWFDIADELDEDKDRTTYSKKFKNHINFSHNSHMSH